ncbi:MAG: MoxR family ATPase [Kiritimatiellia bacterium]|nr:MoxR family ATPase [Kiritimatiellia bacterium]
MSTRQSTHKETHDILVKAAKAGLNVLLEGPHGTGKTAVITEVAHELGFRLKYYSSSTLDPFVDLVGLPVPRTDAQGKPTVIYHRPTDINEAELVFFDEFNRAQPKVLNSILEMIQFRSINGEKLPNLKTVFAACNPAADAYDVVDLDPALLDRFHIHMIFNPGPDREWFAKRFGEKLGCCPV